MKISLCNEVLRDLEFSEQCRFAAAVGYDGIEIAPFTLSEEPHRMTPARVQQLKDISEGEGVPITGLHWLLVTPGGLSITSSDAGTRQKTLDVMKGLIDLCARLGGKVLIHGSPKQRMVEEGQEGKASASAIEILEQAAGHAETARVTYCIEPLSRAETNFINTLDEAAQLVRRIDRPAFRTMLDTKAIRTGDMAEPEAMARKWLPTGLIGHVHLNDQNLRAPGQGKDAFAPFLRELTAGGYDKVASVEPFDYYPDGRAAAARAIGYLRGILEALNQ